MKIGIVGAGLIGRKRALALPTGVVLKAVYDTKEEAALKFAQEFHCKKAGSLDEVLKDKEVEALIIATPNGFLSEIATKAIKAKKHILIEKPGGRTSREIKEIWSAWKASKVVVHFGYNHRFHPGIIKAKEIIDSGKYGPVLFIRAKYGHGGRLGYEKEWRFKKELSGGGELIDQGSHLLNLTNFFIGEMGKVKSTAKTLFWKTSLEDTAFVLLENEKSQVASLSVSCVEWKNLFSFEIMLEKAKIQIDGLGGSYGTEKLTFYKMKPEMGPPETEEFTFDEPDNSWKTENEVFFGRIKAKDYSEQPLKDALYVLETIEKVYQENDL